MAIHGVLGELAFEEPQRVPGLRLRDAGPGEALLQALQTLQGAELLLGMALDIDGVPYIDIWLYIYTCMICDICDIYIYIMYLCIKTCYNNMWIIYIYIDCMILYVYSIDILDLNKCIIVYIYTYRCDTCIYIYICVYLSIIYYRYIYIYTIFICKQAQQ